LNTSLGPRPEVVDFVDSERGSLHVSHYSPRLLLAVVRGHYGAELLPRYMRALADVAASGRAIGFHDWQRMESYDSECRRRMTEWTINNRTRVESVHILVRHRLVAMGVATGALLVGRNLVSTYSERAEFEAALRRHLLQMASESSGKGGA
jgi:hypothetical protein